MLGEDDAQRRRPQPRNRRVYERRIVVAVHDTRAMLRGDARNGAAQRWLEPDAAPKGGDTHVLASQPFAPAAFLVQATDGHWQLGTQSSDELDDEPFRPARIEAQHHLQDFG